MGSATATFHLESSADAAATARTVVRCLLVACGLPGLVDDATLIVSELIGNAVRHAPAGNCLQLEVRVQPDCAHLAVVDSSPQEPVVQYPGPTSPGGRGLQIVDTLATRWGTEWHRTGKRVWAELVRPAG